MKRAIAWVVLGLVQVLAASLRKGGAANCVRASVYRGLLAFALVAHLGCGSTGTSIPKFPGSVPTPVTPASSTQPFGPGDAGLVRQGLWGGDHGKMTVTDTGATLELDCLSGVIAQPLRADADGYFRTHGTLDGKTASFLGAADGESMNLSITFAQTGGASLHADYRLAFGNPGALQRCR